jgi:hypothetical protein
MTMGDKMSVAEYQEERRRIYSQSTGVSERRRWIGLELLGRESEDPTGPEGEARYREMLLKKSRGD